MPMILIVDGRAADRQRVRDVLESGGHAVIDADDAEQALAKARDTKPDLILSEILLSGMDGFEFCRRLQQDPDLRHVPFAFVTVYSGPTFEQLAQDVGALRVLLKPVEPQELRAAVQQLLSIGFAPDATQRFRRLDNDAFRKRHAKTVGSQLEEKVTELEQLARRYKVLSQTNQAIVRLADCEQLFPAICRIAVEHAGLRFAAIALMDQALRRVRMLAQYGDGAGGHFIDFHAMLSNSAGRSPIQAALASGKPIISNDYLGDATAAPWHDAARRAGIGASAVYPLHENGVIVGALELYASESGFFTATMVATLEEMVEDVAFALDNYARATAHMRAEKAAADAAEFNRLLIASSPVGIITYRASGPAVSANEAAAEMVGGTVKQLEALSFREIESWKKSGLLSMAEQALAANRVVQHDVHLPSTTFGKEAWFTSRLVPFQYKSEQYLLALFSNITERVRAEQALRDKDQLLSETQRIAQIGGWQSDLSGGLTWCEEMYRIYGVSPAAFTPTMESFLNMIHPEDRPAMQPWIAAQLEGRNPGDLVFRAVRPDGSIRTVNGRGEPAYDSSKRLIGLRGTAQDITEYRRTYEALEDAKGMYHALVEQQHLVGIFMVDGGKVLYQNPRADEIFGYKPGELVGHSLQALTAEEDWPAAERELGHLLSGETSVIKLDFRGRRKDGREVIVNAQGSLARRGGQPILIGVLQDVTEQRRAEQQINRHVAELEAAFMQTVEVATTLSELRDPYTGGHERRVADIAVAIGAELGFDARRQQGLRVAGYLHDVGKIIIPAEILSKPGKLSPHEFALVKGHPQASYEIIKNVQFPWPVAQVVLQHHERMDGSGYPQGLKGEAILLEARVMAVADVIEAMASHRPYRPGLGLDKALAEIERGRGAVYDPDVVDACLKLYRENGYQLPPE